MTRVARRGAIVGAAIAVLLAVLAPSAATAAPNVPARTPCVGLVVDSGRGQPSTDCVPYRPGLTGRELLIAAGHKLAFLSNGLLCQIDGYPAQCKTDNTHYWAYDLRQPGAAASKWSYAKNGPSTQSARPGQTHGFVYLHGKLHSPAAVPYAQLARTAGPSDSASPGAGSSKDSKDDNGGGSHVGLIVGIAVVVVILAAGLIQLAVRRRSGSRS